MKNETTPFESSIKAGQTIKLVTRFGQCSRGKAWGKCFVGKQRPIGDFEWVDKTGGTLYLTQPGYYIVGSDDGFSRKAKAEFLLEAEVVKETQIA